MPDPKPQQIECRLCNAAAALQFVRDAHDGSEVGLYKCVGCGSLQTEYPYWLAAEYARSSSKDFLNLDTYAAERALRLRKLVYFVWALTGGRATKAKLLDWGGGVGLLVRLLRDIGIDAYLYDKYATNHFASGFNAVPENRYGLVSAFEVLEHLVAPSTELNELFAFEPALLIVSTAVFTGQGPEWPYLGPAKSEHVFFYSDQALDLIASRYNYRRMTFYGDVTIFYRETVSRPRLRMAAAILSRNYLSDILFALIRRRSHCDDDNRVISRKLNLN